MSKLRKPTINDLLAEGRAYSVHEAQRTLAAQLLRDYREQQPEEFERRLAKIAGDEPSWNCLLQ